MVGEQWRGLRPGRKGAPARDGKDVHEGARVLVERVLGEGPKMNHF